MELCIRALGRLKSTDPKSHVIADYLDRTNRLAPNLGFRASTVESHEVSGNFVGTALKNREGQWLLSRVTERDHVIALDERGKDMESASIANHLARQRDDGAPRLVFLVGGADGHGPEISARANAVWRFGKATWPHMLVRVMLCEQIYRAMTILAGHPYHRV
ncbi:MAG: 23S rRNA (pseudouridine(1915)-N(3))-methyltransferase RlmH [Pseudomonadota bacterium]